MVQRAKEILKRFILVRFLITQWNASILIESVWATVGHHLTSLLCQFNLDLAEEFWYKQVKTLGVFLYHASSYDKTSLYARNSGAEQCVLQKNIEVIAPDWDEIQSTALEGQAGHCVALLSSWRNISIQAALPWRACILLTSSLALLLASDTDAVTWGRRCSC